MSARRFSIKLALSWALALCAFAFVVWVVPIRDPGAFVERLRWCAAHRSELAEMASRVYAAFKPRDWDQVAADFEALCHEVG